MKKQRTIKKMIPLFIAFILINLFCITPCFATNVSGESTTKIVNNNEIYIPENYTYPQVSINIDRYYNPSYINFKAYSPYGISEGEYTIEKILGEENATYKTELFLRASLETPSIIPKEPGYYLIHVIAKDNNGVDLLGDNCFGGKACSYLFTIYTDEQLKQVENAADKFISECNFTDDTSVYNKLDAVYNKFYKECSYYPSNKAVDYSDITKMQNNTEYSALVNKNTRCSGYSAAVKMVLDKLGINNYLVYGSNLTNEGHSWNIVEVNNKWYHFDVTSDKPKTDTSGWFNGFLKADFECKMHNNFYIQENKCIYSYDVKSMSWSKSKGYPECEFSYNYTRPSLNIVHNKDNNTYEVKVVSETITEKNPVMSLYIIYVPKGTDITKHFEATIRNSQYYDKNGNLIFNGKSYGNKKITGVDLIDADKLDTDNYDYYYYTTTKNGIRSCGEKSLWTKIEFPE